MTGHLAGAMKEAAAGLLDAKLAADTLESVFLDAVGPAAHRQQTGPVPDRRGGGNEWRGLLAWAVAQGRAADPAETVARVAEKVPSQVTELRRCGVPGHLDRRPGRGGDARGPHPPTVPAAGLASALGR